MTETFLRIFREHCKCDKSFLDYIVESYYWKAVVWGRLLYEKSVRWSYAVDPMQYSESMEFLAFVDGNGFKVVKAITTTNCFHIYPIYE